MCVIICIGLRMIVLVGRSSEMSARKNIQRGINRRWRYEAGVGCGRTNRCVTKAQQHTLQTFSQVGLYPQPYQQHYVEPHNIRQHQTRFDNNSNHVRRTHMQLTRAVLQATPLAHIMPELTPVMQPLFFAGLECF
jgi:hypothetical protein